jgi:mono/diheme cytochrome c family protein
MAKVFASCAAGMLSIVLLAAAAPSDGTRQERPPSEDPNSGSYLYRIYCASCHGASGHGDGPAARTLQTALPDLTTIAERHGGSYPSAEIARIIDGRKPLPSHTVGDMPRWGVILERMEGGNERAGRARIDALVGYLESLQRKR